MIQYSLKCDRDHTFDSWFKSADAFEKLHENRLLSCAVCGSAQVNKAIMAPRVNNAAAKPARALGTADTPSQEALRKLRKHIESSSDYVGPDFASEARAIHDGDAPDRPIWGEARHDEARKLIEDGVPVAPLPFVPSRKSN